MERYSHSDPEQENVHVPRDAIDDGALGLVALAGYQNRDKLAELLKGATGNNAQPGTSNQQGPLGGLTRQSRRHACRRWRRRSAGRGLGELLEHFKQNGQGEAAESWINKGPNKELPAPQLKQAIGADVLAALEQQTGLSQEELLARLSRELPSPSINIRLTDAFRTDIPRI